MAKISVNGKKIGRPKDPSKWVKKVCLECGIKFEARRCYTKRGQMKYCSGKCGYPNSGKRNGRWNGGIRFERGYIKIYSPEHPYRDSYKRVYKHRLIMEKHLGRFLNKTEVVHHINHNRSDNRITNLKLYNNHSEHMKEHRAKS